MANLTSTMFPNTDTGLLAWSLNFSTLITATPTAYGLTSAQATAYAAAHSTFATALMACDPNSRNKTSTAAKNAARANLKTQAKLLSNMVNGTASVTVAQKIELGIPPRTEKRGQKAFFFFGLPIGRSELSTPSLHAVSVAQSVAPYGRPRFFDACNSASSISFCGVLSNSIQLPGRATGHGDSNFRIESSA